MEFFAKKETSAFQLLEKPRRHPGPKVVVGFDRMSNKLCSLSCEKSWKWDNGAKTKLFPKWIFSSGLGNCWATEDDYCIAIRLTREFWWGDNKSRYEILTFSQRWRNLCQIWVVKTQYNLDVIKCYIDDWKQKELQPSFYAFNGRTSNSELGYVISLGVKPSLDNHSLSEMSRLIHNSSNLRP